MEDIISSAREQEDTAPTSKLAAGAQVEAVKEGCLCMYLSMDTESKGLRMVDIALRILASLLSLLSLSLLLSSTRSLPPGFTFTYFRPFGYLFVASTIVLIHSVIQAGVSGWCYLRKCSFNNDACYYPYCRLAKDLVCMLLSLSASSAVLGATTIYSDFDGSTYIKQGNGAAALSLIAFLCLLNSSCLSLYRLS